MTTGLGRSAPLGYICRCVPAVGQRSQQSYGRDLHVGNLPYQTGETELTELFSKAGTVETARVMRDMATGRARGFGFVEMATDEEAQRAISELNEYQLEGRTLVVNEARPKPMGLVAAPGPTAGGPAAVAAGARAASLAGRQDLSAGLPSGFGPPGRPVRQPGASVQNSRLATADHTAYASRRRSWRAMSPYQNSPSTSSQVSGAHRGPAAPCARPRSGPACPPEGPAVLAMTTSTGRPIASSMSPHRVGGREALHAASFGQQVGDEDDRAPAPSASASRTPRTRKIGIRLV